MRNSPGEFKYDITKTGANLQNKKYFVDAKNKDGSAKYEKTAITDREQFNRVKPILNTLILSLYYPTNDKKEWSYRDRVHKYADFIDAINKPDFTSKYLPVLVDFIDNNKNNLSSFFLSPPRRRRKTTTEAPSEMRTAEDREREQYARRYKTTQTFAYLMNGFLHENQNLIKSEAFRGSNEQPTHPEDRVQGYITMPSNRLEQLKEIINNEEEPNGYIISSKFMEKLLFGHRHDNYNNTNMDDMNDILRVTFNEFPNKEVRNAMEHEVMQHIVKNENKRYYTYDDVTEEDANKEADEIENIINKNKMKKQKAEKRKMDKFIEEETEHATNENTRAKWAEKYDLRTFIEKNEERMETDSNNMLHKITPTIKRPTDSQIEFYRKQILNDEHTPYGFKQSLKKIKKRDKEVNYAHNLAKLYKLDDFDDDFLFYEKDIPIDKIKDAAKAAGATEEDLKRIYVQSKAGELDKISDVYNQTLNNMAEKMHKYYSSMSDDVINNIGGINRATLYRNIKEQKRLNKEEELMKLLNTKFNVQAVSKAPGKAPGSSPNNVFNPKTVEKANAMIKSSVPKPYLSKLVARKANIMTRAQTGIQRRTFLTGAAAIDPV